MTTERIPFGLSFNEALQTIGFLFACVIVLLIVFAFVFDKLDVKTFSFRNGFTFYQDGDEKKSRITHRKKIVRKVAKKK